MTRPKYKTLDGKWVRGYIAPEPEKTEGLYPHVMGQTKTGKNDTGTTK